MKTIAFTMIALGLAVAALPAAAQGQTSFTLEAHSEGGGGYFTLEGQTERNPTLNVAPGASITVTIKAADAAGVHNFKVDGGPAGSEYVSEEGATATYTFTAPASGTVEYFCEPHRGAGMKGMFSAGGATTTNENDNGGESNESPGLGTLGVALAMVGVALLLARRQK